jgi:hypothetical protein
MISARQFLRLVDQALRLCEGALARAGDLHRDEFVQVRNELPDWRSEATHRWPPSSEFVERTKTLGVYAARELWEQERRLAEAIVAVRGALTRSTSS